VRGGARWLLVLAVLGSLLLAPLAAAEEEDEAIDVEKLARERQVKAALYPYGRRIQRYLAKAGEAIDEGDYDEARALLARLRPSRLNPYERAMVYRFAGYVDYSSANYQGAIDNFQKVLDEEILPVRDDNRIRFNIAQLYASLQQWPEVIAALHRWLRYTPNPDPLGYYLLGIAHYQLEQLDESIVWAEKAVDSSPEPPESWLQLLAALFVQKEDYENVTPVLEELVLRYPKKQYWVQLALIYGARENYRNSLAVQQVAYLQGFLTDDKELQRLARSYLYHNLPYPAAQVLEKAIEDGYVEADAKSLELLANSWIAAREYERSLPPLRKAAEFAEDGNLSVRLGQVYMQREDWAQAAELLQRAIDKGGLKNPGNAQLLLGICYYNDQRVPQARSSFARARKHDATRSAAERWMTHIDKETGSG
jgi:tetratricopeptide (TPR) repeat protein